MADPTIYQRLTDRTSLAGALTSAMLYHIVDPEDSSQDAAGSSYKATIQDLVDFLETVTFDALKASQYRDVIATLTDATNISWNWANGNIAVVTLGNNRTLANPTNKQAGRYTLIVKQDGTGGHTLAFGSNYLQSDGTITLNNGANEYTVLTFVSQSATSTPDIHVSSTGTLQEQISDLNTELGNKVDKVTSTDKAVVRFDGTSGDVQESGVTIDDSDVIHAPSVQASTSGGLSLKNNAGTEVALLGAGGGTGVTLAGQLNGHAIKGYRPFSTQTGTTYTFVLGDANSMVIFNNASAITVTIPNESDVAFEDGIEIELFNLGDGLVTLDPDIEITVVSKDDLLSLSAKGAAAILKKIGSDSWILIGDLA